MEVADPDRAVNIMLTGHLEGGVLMGCRMKREIKGMLTGLGVTFRTMMKPTVTVQYPHEREEPPTARPRRDRVEGRELHGLHALRAFVPRLVHLHRGAQGAAPAPP